MDEPDAVRPFERRPERQQFVKRRAQGIQVAPGVGDAAEPLRGHVPQRPDDVPGVREVARLLGLGQAEIGDPDVAQGVEDQVRRLDVAVEDVPGVRVGEGAGHLRADPCDLPVVSILGVLGEGRGRCGFPAARRARLSSVIRGGGRKGVIGTGGRGGLLIATREERTGHRQRPFAGGADPAALIRVVTPPEPSDVLDDAVETLPGDVPHRVVEHAVVLAVVEDADDVGVVELGRDAGLDVEPAEVGVTAPEVRVHDLEGDRGPERLALGLVDHPHAAATDESEDLVVAHPRRGRVGGPGRGRPRVDVPRDRLQPLDLDEGREQLTDVVGQLRVRRPRTR